MYYLKYNRCYGKKVLTIALVTDFYVTASFTVVAACRTRVGQMFETRNPDIQRGRGRENSGTPVLKAYID